MQLAIQPPVTTLPVRPMPPMSMAHDLLDRVGTTLTDLGASSVDVVDSQTLRVVYNNNFKGVQAAGAIKDVVDGVRILVENHSLTKDFWTVTGENVASWLGQSAAVEKVESAETSPVQLKVFGASGQAESALASLLRPELADGTSIEVARRMWAL